MEMELFYFRSCLLLLILLFMLILHSDDSVILCHGLSNSNEPFQIKSVLELRENNLDNGYISYIKERYSPRERRAIIEISSNSPKRITSINDKESNVISYYYIHDIWLKTIGEGRCLESSKSELTNDLFNGNEIKSFLSRYIDQRENSSTGYIVGPLQLLLAIDQLKPLKSLRAKKKFFHGIETEAYLFNLDDGQPKPKTIIEILYSARVNQTLAQIHHLRVPLILKLTIENSLTLRIRFFQTLFMESQTKMKFDNSFSLPLNSGCSNVLSKLKLIQQEDDEIETRLFGYEKFSFKLSELDQNHDWIFKFYFDTKMKLVRKDIIPKDLEEFDEGVSTTIYDYSKRLKYHSVTKSNINQASSSTLTPFECVTERMAPENGRSIDFNLADWERLKFMGRSLIDGKIVRVYEDSGGSYLPGWLYPPVWSLVRLPDMTDKLMLVNEVTDTNEVILIYYINEASQFDLGNLVRFDVIVRDTKRDLQLVHRQFQVSSFIWDQTLSINDDRFVVDVFSLGALCPNHKGEFFQAKLLIEPVGKPAGAEQKNRQMAAVASHLIHLGVKRNDYLIRTLNEAFQIERPSVDWLSSRLLNTNPSSNSSLSSPIELEFRASLFGHEQVECVQLGRGHLKSKGHLLMRISLLVSFDDCLWLARSKAYELGKDVLFTFDWENFECLVDELYRNSTDSTRTPSMSQINVLNYFPDENGHYIIYKLRYFQAHETSPPDWSILKAKSSLNFIGKSLEVKTEVGTDFEYKLAQLDIWGPLVSGSNLDKSFPVDNIAWRSTGIDDGLVRVVTESLTVGPKRSAKTNTMMTKDFCKSLCLKYSECNSYSICDHQASLVKLECTLSKISINDPNNKKALDSILAGNLSDTDGKLATFVSVKLDGTPHKAGISLNRMCSIFSKSHLDLFRGGQLVFLDNLNHLQKYQVNDENECARVCSNKNIDYLNQVQRHKLEFSSIIHNLDIISEVDYNNNPQSSLVNKLATFSDWRQKYTSEFCSNFYYMKNETHSNGLDMCILTNSNTTPITYSILPDSIHNSDGSSETAQKFTKKSVELYKLNYVTLYDRMDGFRLIGEPEMSYPKLDHNGDDEKKQSTLVQFYKLLLKSHYEGMNIQVQLPIEDVDYCARACTLQIHGPRPACASFDLVYERFNSSYLKYCLLNTQTYYDIMALGKSDQIITETGNVNCRYWHFEPQKASFIDNSSGKFVSDTMRYEQQNRVQISQLIDRLRGGSQVAAFNSFGISVFLFLASVLISLISGMCLGNWWLKKEPSNSNYPGTVMRLVHRLSGVSMNGLLLDSEVRM